MTSKSSVLDYQEPLKVDRNGLPLIPQPSASLLDPLNYPTWLKHVVLVEVSLLGFASGLAGNMTNPAVDQVLREFHISPRVATFQSTITAASSALAGFLLVPFANIYGHRIVFLVSSLLTAVFSICAAELKTFGSLVAFRGLAGVYWVNIIVGVAAISSIFFAHQKGRAIGFFTVVAFNGSHLAPIVGGFVASRFGWRWTLRLAAIIMGVMTIIIAFMLPDTLFQRPNQANALVVCTELDKTTDSNMTSELHRPPALTFSTYLRYLRLVDRERMPSRGLRLSDFFSPYQMLRHPFVIFPALNNAIVTTYSFLGPLTIGPVQFTEVFHFDAAQNGLAMGLSLILGTFIGEFFSGPATDFFIQRTRRNGQNPEPEVRLRSIWLGAAIVPLGLLMYVHHSIQLHSIFVLHSRKLLVHALGLDLEFSSEYVSTDGFTIHYATTFIAPCVALAFTCVGAQISSSVCYTYACSDCYPKRSGDISQIFNFIRGLSILALSFYEQPLGKRIGYHIEFTLFAIICLLASLGIVALIVKGTEWRKRSLEILERDQR